MEKLERHQHAATEGAPRFQSAEFNLMLVDELVVWDAVALIIDHDAVVSIVLIVEGYLLER